MGLKVGELFATLGLESNGFTKGMANAEKTFDGLSKKFAMSGAGLTLGLSVPLFKFGQEAFNSARAFETAFTGVRKTVDASEAEFGRLEKSILGMSMEIPATSDAIAGVVESAGQLGIANDYLMDFTRVMIDLGNSTNLSAGDAATTLARFANITGMSAKDYSRLGSVIVGLGNNFATTEAEIADMAMRIAGAGSQVGLTEAQIMGISAALSSVGIRAEAGGTSVSQFFSKMSLAVSKGGKGLKAYAKVAGLSVKDFKKLFKEDAAGAFTAFIAGLQKAKDPIKTLTDMGIVDTQMRDALLRLAGGGDLLSNALDSANKEWTENTALTEEAKKRYATMDSAIQIAKNTVTEFMRELGGALAPYIMDAVEGIKGLAKSFTDMSPEAKDAAVKVGLVLAALGPGTALLGGFFKILASGAGVLKYAFGPLGLVAAGLFAIYKLSPKLQTKVKQLGSFFGKFWKNIKNGKGITNSLELAFRQTFGKGLYLQVKDNLKKAGEVFEKTIGWFKDTGSGLQQAWTKGSTEGGFFGGIVESAKYLGGRVGDALKSGWDTVRGAAKQLAQQAMTALGNTLKDSTYFSGLGTELIEAALALEEGKPIDFSGLFAALVAGVSGWVNGVLIPWVNRINWGEVWTAFWNVLSNVGLWIGTQAMKLGPVLNQIISKIRDWKDTVLTKWVQAIDWSAVWASFWATMTDITTWLGTDVTFDYGYLVGKISAGIAGIGSAIIAELKKALAPGEDGTLTTSKFWEIVLGTSNWFVDASKAFITGMYNGFMGTTFDWTQVEAVLNQGWDDFIAWIDSLGARAAEALLGKIKGGINELFTHLGLEEPFEIPVKLTPEGGFVPGGATGGAVGGGKTDTTGGGRTSGAGGGGSVGGGRSTILQSALPTPAETQKGIDILRNAITQGLIEVPTNVKTVGTDTTTNLATGITSTLNLATTAANTLGTSTLGGIASKLTDTVVKGLGLNFVKGFANGITNNLSWITTAATAAAAAALNAANKKLESGSPSRAAFRIGGFFSKGMANGIKAATSLVFKASSSLSGAMLSGASYTPARRPQLAFSAPGANYNQIIDYDRLARAVASRPAYFDVNGQRMARATVNDYAHEESRRSARVNAGYGTV